MSKHVFHLSETAPQVSTPYGARAAVRSDDFPILERMSLARLTLEAGGFREPHLMGNAWGLPADALAGLPKGPEDMFAGRVDGTPELAKSASYPNELKLDLECMSAAG